jgi:hypothetical protein
VQRAAKPALAGGAAVAAVAGGLAVGKALRPKRRTIDLRHVAWPKLPMTPPNMPDVHSVAKGLSKAGQQVGRTGEQLAKIGGDVQNAGETTERIGKLLAK